MSNFNDLDDIFKDDLGDEIDLEGTAFSVDDFEEDLFEEQPQTSINRTFLFAGGSLLATFAVIVAAIVAIGSGDPNTDKVATANAITTYNAATQTSIAITAVAFETQGAIDAAETVTADAAIVLTRDASVLQTQSAIDAQVAATQTSIAAAATQTQGAIETSFALTQTANAPTPLPTVQVGFELRDANGNPVQEGVVIYVYRDDGDRQFNPLPSPTIAATATPTLTPTIDASVTPTTNPTSVALTQQAQISEFDQRSTARAQQLTQTASAAGTTPNAIQSTATRTPTIAPTTVEAPDTIATPVAEAVTTDQAALLGDEQQLANDIFSVRVPVEWTVAYPSPSEIVFSESFEGLDFRTDAIETLEDPTLVGLGGRLTAYLPTEIGATAVDEGGMDSLVAQVLAQFEAGGIIEVLEAPRNVPTLLNANFARVGVVRGEVEEGYIIFLGFDDYFVYGSVMAPVGQFEDNRELLFGIIETIIAPPQSEEPVGFAPNDDGNTSFLKISGPVPQSGHFQGGPTSTPPPDGDEEGIPIRIGPNGQGQIILPGEPGTYFLVLELAPGVYTLFIEGQAIEITVIEGQVTESTVILGDRTLIIRTRGLPPNIPTPTLTLTATPTQGVIADTPISPFLQTATAAARTALPAITETATVETGTPGTPSSPTLGPTAIPETGLNVSTDATTPEGLAMLAIMGIGLLGVVFVVRRLRSNIE